MIGGGIVGCISANYLRQKGHEVQVVDSNLWTGQELTKGNASLLCFDSTFSLFEHPPHDFKSLTTSLWSYPTWSWLYAKRLWDQDEVKRSMDSLVDASHRSFESFISKSNTLKLPLSPKGIASLEGEPMPETRIAHSESWARQLEKAPLVRTVTGFQMQDGLIKAALTNGGEPIEADLFVLSTGYNPRLTSPIPLLPVWGQALVRIDPAISHPPFVDIRDGRVLLQNGHETRLTYGALVRASKKEALKDLQKMQVDKKDDLLWNEIYTNPRPVSPDGLPIVDRDPKISNLYYNLGHGFFGWTMAFVSADILSDLIEGKTHPLAKDVALDRF